jgi:hypothetical protein
MNKQEFIELIRNPYAISSGDTEKLEYVVENFPYCQSAHLLIAKIAHQQSSMLAKQKLNKAAAYVLERKKLKIILEPGEAAESVKYTGTSEYNGLPVNEAIISLTPVQEEIMAVPGISVVNAGGINNDTTTIDIHSRVQGKEDTLSKKEEEGRTDGERTGEIQVVEKDSVNLLKETEVPGQEIEINTALVDKNTANTGNEPVLESKAAVNRSSFFEELEKNLENLRRLKAENAIVLSSQHAKNLIKVEEPPILGNGNTIAASNTVANIQSVPSEIPKVSTYPIYSSRLEDVMVYEPERKDQQQELMTEYLNFLALRKKLMFRSKEKINNIIERFIQEDPSIPYLNNKKAEETVTDLSEESTRETNHIASENFAKILVRQGKYEKAVAIYNELSLKNPEKKAYFASLIEKLKQ